MLKISAIEDHGAIKAARSCKTNLVYAGTCRG